MFKIDHSTALPARPANAIAGTEGWFTEGDPDIGQVATVVTHDFLNMLQAEMSNIITNGSLTNDKDDDTQVLSALQNIFWHSGNDGAGSGLDADLLDGINSSAFIRADQDDIAAGNHEFYATDTSGDYQWSPIEIREVALNNNAITTAAYAPALAFHWGGVSQAQLALESDGVLRLRDGTTHSTLRTLDAGDVKINGNSVWHSGNDGSGSGLDADKLDSYNLNVSNSSDTVVRRDSLGDITSRMFRSEYDSTNANIGFIMTQVNTGADNYVRPSTPAQVLAALNIPPQFASGTRLLFSQASPPTGWTQDTSTRADNRMMRVVNTTGNGYGGSGSPIVSHNHTTSSHTLTTAQMPSHRHSKNTDGPQYAGQFTGVVGYYPNTSGSQTGYTGGGGSHTHGNTGTLSAPRYLNLILCTKN